MAESNRSIHVLHLITLFSVGGATETVVSLTKGLGEAGFNVTIVSGPPIESEGNMKSIARSLGLNVEILPTLKRNVRPIADAFALFRLVRVMRQGNFDIVHTHSAKAGILGRIAARLAGVKNVVHTIHGLPFHAYQSQLLKRAYIFIEKSVATLTTKFLAVSEKIVEECLEHRIGVPEQYRVVRSGFNTRLYLARDERDHVLSESLQIRESDFVIGIISRLSNLKGHEEFIRVLPTLFNDHHNLRILFVGDGEMRSELEQQVNALGASEKVIFAGSVQPPDIPKYISVMHTVVHTSLHEGLPRVVPQALLMGKPVVCYNLDGAPEIIEDDRNGILVPPLDDARLVLAIGKVINEYERFHEYCVRKKQVIATEFDERSMVSQVTDIYRDLLRRSA